MSGSRSRTGRDGRAISTALFSLGLLVVCATAVVAQEPERLADGVALGARGASSCAPAATTWCACSTRRRAPSSAAGR